MRSHTVTAIALVTVAIASLPACGSDDPEPTSQSTTDSSPSAASSLGEASEAPDPMAEPVVDGMFSAAGDYQLAVRCWGEGSPTVVYDAGTDDTGIGQAQGSSVVRELASRTRVCSYDRAGIGASDPAPQRERHLDDVVNDLHAVLIEAGIDPPYLMVGSSGGGFDVFHHAGRYPADVAALVMLDVPRGQADIPEGEIPPWNSPLNPEHMDYYAVERQMALERLPIPPIPVTVVTAAQGQSADPKEQRVWLKGSSDPRQVIVESGHDVFNENPDAVLKEILKLLAGQPDPTAPSASAAALDGVVTIDGDRGLYVRCTGTGSPTVILEAGDDDDIASYGFAERALSEVTRTCVYDRANLGQSDPDPGPRGLKELVGDFENLIEAADIPGPYVLVGTSGGGYISAGYAVEHPRQVAGMVFVEVPGPFWNPPRWLVEVATWDHRENVENRDYLRVEKEAWAARRQIGDIPLTVISNEYSAGEIAAAEFPEERLGMRRNVQVQRGWFVLSPLAEQLVVHTGHAVEEADPELVLDAILDVVEEAR